MSHTIAFIGGGNMAGSLIGGLINQHWNPHQIRVSDPDPQRRQALLEGFKVKSMADNQQAIADCDAVVLAVKPNLMRQVCQQLAEALGDCLVISIAAGVREQDISRWLGDGHGVVRSMPNTPALLGSGITGLYANQRCDDSARQLADTIMAAVGQTVWVEQEPLLDVVTAISGSGPAYFFLLMELMQQAGEEMGLSREAAHLLTTQTALGAARMATTGEDEPGLLREKVTSPGGTTQRAIASMQEDGLAPIVARALKAARDRAEEMGKELGAVQ